MTNKYRMSVEDNILFAKRNIIDSIWKEANIEGIGVTFPDTREIFEGRTVPNVSVKDTVVINNLKHAWQFILDTLDVPIDVPYVRQVNSLIGAGIVLNAGQLRQSDVSIGGTKWRPVTPDYESAKTLIAANMERPAGQERALTMFADLCRAQLFYDGNKRTAQIIANKMLIADGAGVFAIPVDNKRDFEFLLLDFYETGNSTALISFLDKHALDGVKSLSVSQEKEQSKASVKEVQQECTDGAARLEAENKD